MKKIIAALRFLFRKRLYISASFVQAKLKDFRYPISQKAIANYNKAVKNKEDIIIGEPPSMHPLFFAKINFSIVDNLNDYLEKKISPDLVDTLVHQSEQIFLHEIPREVNELLVRSKIIEIKAHKRGTKLVIKFEYFAGDLAVATEYSSAIMFGVKLKGAAACLEVMPWPTAVKGQPIWTSSIVVDKNLPYAYAELAEIDAPIHTNPSYAKSIGLPGIILQGTCTFAKAVSRIVAKELGHDYSKVKGVAARFTGHVLPPNTLHLRLLKKSSTELCFEVANDKNETVIKGGTVFLK